MTVGEFLQAATTQLTADGIETARLDVLVLMEDVLGINRANILAHPEVELADDQLDTLQHAVSRRGIHVPLAYIRGRAAFYGREFMVNENVLVPRPETESMIELLKTVKLPENPKIVDLGCGSGCIGITASLEIPNTDVYLFDIDDKALEVATKNALYLRARAHVIHHDLLEMGAKEFDVILANLPYVPDAYPINQAAAYEPSIALFAGNDGLDLYRRMWQQIGNMPPRPNHVLTESLLDQHESIANMAKAAGYHLEQTDGLVQLFTLHE